MGKKKPAARDEGGQVEQQQGGGRSRKKNGVIDDDEYSIGTEASEEAAVAVKEEKAVGVGGGKKKGKKGRGLEEEVEDEGLESVVVGKKKSGGARKGGNRVVSKSGFELLGGEDDENGESVDSDRDEPVVTFTGKKKSAKGSKKGGNNAVVKSGFELLGDDEDGVMGESVQSDEDEPVVSFVGKKKPSKGKKNDGNNAVITSSFDLLGDEDNAIGESVQSDADEPLVSFGGKKSSKGSKSNGANSFSAASFSVLDDEDEVVADSTVTDESSTVDVNKSVSEDEIFSFTGKKKKSKSSDRNKAEVFAGSSFDALDEVEDSRDEDKDADDDTAVIAFTGKKKSSKSSKKSESLVSSTLLEANGEAPSFAALEDDPVDEVEITFSGKKKSSKKKSATAFAALEDDTSDTAEIRNNIEPDISVASRMTHAEVVESSKNKKKKKSGRTPLEDDDLDKILAELGEGPPVVTPDIAPADKADTQPEQVLEDTVVDVPESKATDEVGGNNKKKKKKSKRTAQEEEDLDKLLAELGEGPSSSNAVQAPDSDPIQQEKVELLPETAAVDEATVAGEGEEEAVVESAAAKKKKKKKEKEKKAVAAATAEVKDEKQEERKNEAKSKAADKKLPKHVREMQEALARRQEAEERKKREEEERLKKEEEERLRQEELERLAEEAKRRKKEREKEKLLKKKQEGKLLTAKQKEGQRRLEATRNQLLANKGISLSAGDNTPPARRPIYTSKKTKLHQSHANGNAPVKPENLEEEEMKAESASDINASEPEKIEEVDDATVEEEAEAASEEKDNGMEKEVEEEDDDWDAKSWDDANIALPVKGAFDDEEVEPEPATVVRKDIKRTVQASHDVLPPTGDAKHVANVKKSNSSQPAKPEVTESKQPPAEVVASNKNKGNKTTVKKGEDGSNSQSKENDSNLRSPICCIMGHVDTGKTKLLDCIRGTNVQEGEAGGITQQIGATYFPAENIRERTKELKADAKLKVPGLLVIDTPGHESFTNLRSRGSGLCDIAILVVDIMHGLEPQTIESLNLLKMRNTEFIVALNKIDRLYGWKASRNAPFIKTIKEQSKHVVELFNTKVKEIVTEFMEQGLNTALYYKNKEMGETFSIVPTSAITGEGIPDLLLLLVQWAQKTMVEKLTFSDEIQGPIVTTIRALLTPHPMKELRVKGTYLHHKEIKAAQGIKITAQGLEHAIAGTALYVVEPDDDVERIKELAMEDMQSVLSRIDKSGEGVCVQASTLGSLEALLEFLKSPVVNIPVSGISIGPVHKKDVMKASVMLEKKKEYATILAFDVKVTPEAREYAEENGVTIFMADIIYHLFDQFKAYIDNLKEEKKKEAADEAVFPCVLQILPNCIFNKKDPIVLGVDVVEGIAKVGTPICVPARDFIDIGRIASIENNHKPVDIAKKGQKVAIKIVGATPEEQQKMFGRHFEIDDELVSHVSRKSIDVLKANYRDDLSMEDWRLVVKLKTLFKIQ
ncbi:Eukaryotic translation initiation factor 5B-like protein [Drosera capensis]